MTGLQKSAACWGWAGQVHWWSGAGPGLIFYTTIIQPWFITADWNGHFYENKLQLSDCTLIETDTQLSVIYHLTLDHNNLPRWGSHRGAGKVLRTHIGTGCPTIPWGLKSYLDPKTLPYARYQMGENMKVITSTLHTFFPLLHIFIYVELIFGYEPIMCSLHFIVLANFNNKIDMSI